MLFFRTQRKYRFYSSSLLVAYDARRLHQYCSDDNDYDSTRTISSMSSSRTIISDANASKKITAPYSSTASVSAARIAKRDQTEVSTNSMLKRSVSLNNSGFTELIESGKILDGSGSCSPDMKVDHHRLCRSCPTQSYANSFDDTTKNNDHDVPTTNEYDTVDKHGWVRVNMIDFTHVFPADDDSSLDLNYLEGIENLIKLMETFLARKDGLKQENSRTSTIL